MSYQAEVNLLGKIIITGVNPEAREALNLITAEMLTVPLHIDILTTINALDRAGHNVSLESVEAHLNGMYEFTAIATMVGNVSRGRDVIQSARQVRMSHTNVVNAHKMTRLVEQMQSGSLFDRSEAALMLNEIAGEMALDQIDSSPVWFSEYSHGYIDILESRQGNPGDHYLDIGLDVEINRTDLIVMGGTPGMGKTALALYISNHVASQGKPVLMFSLEMEGGQVFEREVSRHANVSTRQLKRIGEDGLTDAQWGGVATGLSALKSLPIAIDDGANMDLPGLLAKCRKFKNQNPSLALIVLDYLTLLKLPNGERQDLRVAAVTRALKMMAMEIKCPILVLSQMNREAAKMRREPQNSDLRDSGAIEQDADKILFPYRDEVYDQNSPNKGLAKVLKTKVRDGEPGSVLLGFTNGNFHQLELNRGWAEPVEPTKKSRGYGD